MLTRISLIVTVAACMVASANSVTTKVGDSCARHVDCTGRDQSCSEFGRCDCAPGRMLFAGDCVGVRRHAEKCAVQIECSMSGDPNLHCSAGFCRCRRGTVYSHKQCRTVNAKSGHRQPSSEDDNDVHHVG